MKKSMAVLPLVAMIGIGTPSAQSKVTLFGIVDTGVSSYQNQSQGPFGNTFTVSQTALTNSAYNSSRLGFRGTEDLGGGLAASFWLEAGVNTDDGTGIGSNGSLYFNRRSTVSSRVISASCAWAATTPQPIGTTTSSIPSASTASAPA